MADVSTYRSDTGPFVVVPVWVLELPISHLAFRLYAIHADLADRDGTHFHGRKALADRLGCSVDTLDRANEALVAAQALAVQRRKDKAGDATSNRYVVRRVRPSGVAAQLRLPGRTDAATGGRTDAARSNTKDFLLTNARERESVPASPALTREDARRAVRDLLEGGLTQERTAESQ